MTRFTDPLSEPRFNLAYFGLRTQTLPDWSKNNVIISKILLGALFLVMACLIAMA